MWDCLLDALIDSLKLLPYLVVTFLILELIEHKIKYKKVFSKKRRLMPVAGGLLGALPQCGISAMAANLFSSHIITVGTLIAIFLSTSDEMLPLMLGEQVEVSLILKTVGLKVLIGVIIGLIVDFIWQRKTKNKAEPDIAHFCEGEHCNCEKNGIIISSLLHTLKTFLFVLVANMLINILIFMIGEETIANVLLGKNFWVVLLSALIGLIPNCAGSIIVTELYLSGLLSFGSMMAGLLTGSGIGWLLLVKNNKNYKENAIILAIIYAVGVIFGGILNLF